MVEIRSERHNSVVVMIRYYVYVEWLQELFNTLICYITSASDTIRKLPLAKAQTALEKQKNKIQQRRIFNMADGILSPSNVAHDSGVMSLNSPGGSTLHCDTWLWDDTLLNSPGGNTLQCGTWLWEHDI